MKLKMKIALLAVLAISFGILYFNAYVLNQPCSHSVSPLNEADKIPLNEQTIDRLRKALSIRTISSHESQDHSALKEFIKFIRTGFLSKFQN